MNQQYEKTGGYARKPRDCAGNANSIIRILKSRNRGRPFDPVAYAAALEILG